MTSNVIEDTNNPKGTDSGVWTFEIEKDIDEVSIALQIAGIEVEGLSQNFQLGSDLLEAGYCSVGAGVSKPEITVIYHSEWIDKDSLPNMPFSDGAWVFLPNTDWNKNWRESIQPVRIDNVLIVPPWLDAETEGRDGDIRILLDPGVAFGSGHHETTALCIKALLEEDLDGAFVADIGTGTGILAAVAAARGASRIVCTDIDPEAIKVANNLLTTHKKMLFPNTVVEIREGSAGSLMGKYDIVLANMITPTLIDLSSDLAGLLRPYGRLIMSGISNANIDKIVSRFSALGLVVKVTEGEEWALAVGMKLGF